MANNEHVNKVVYGDQTLIDLSSDTVTPQGLQAGLTAHDASGALITGTNEGGDGEGYVWQDAQGYIHLSDNQGTDFVANIIAEPYDSTATYSVGDYCSYNGLFYKCNTDISTAEAWTAAHWTQTVVVDEMGTGNGNSPYDMIVTLTLTYDYTAAEPQEVYTADKTLTEVVDAIENGEVIGFIWRVVEIGQEDTHYYALQPSDISYYLFYNQTGNPIGVGLSMHWLAFANDHHGNIIPSNNVMALKWYMENNAEVFEFVGEGFGATVPLPSYTTDNGKILKALDGAWVISDLDIDNKVNGSVVADGYSNTSTYTVGDYCFYNGKLYQCNTPIAVAETWTPAHWTETSIADALANTGSGRIKLFDAVGLIAIPFVNGVVDTQNIYNEIPIYQLLEKYDSTLSPPIGRIACIVYKYNASSQMMADTEYAGIYPLTDFEQSNDDSMMFTFSKTNEHYDSNLGCTVITRDTITIIDIVYGEDNFQEIINYSSTEEPLKTLPSVTSSDNGKIMQVQNGTWQKTDLPRSAYDVVVRITHRRGWDYDLSEYVEVWEADKSISDVVSAYNDGQSVCCIFTNIIDNEILNAVTFNYVSGVISSWDGDVNDYVTFQGMIPHYYPATEYSDSRTGFTGCYLKWTGHNYSGNEDTFEYGQGYYEEIQSPAKYATWMVEATLTPSSYSVMPYGYFTDESKIIGHNISSGSETSFTSPVTVSKAQNADQCVVSCATPPTAPVTIEIYYTKALM